MRPTKFLYSRGVSSDYRWILRPEASGLIDYVRDEIWEVSRKYFHASEALSVPMCFGIALGNEVVIGRCRRTNVEDFTGRPIDALEGLWGARPQLPLLLAAAHAIVGCQDTTLDFWKMEYERLRNEVTEWDSDLWQLVNTFWDLYKLKIEAAQDDVVKDILSFDESGYISLLVRLEKLSRMGGMKNFIFGLGKEINSDSFGCEITAPIEVSRTGVGQFLLTDSTDAARRETKGQSGTDASGKLSSVWSHMFPVNSDPKK